MKKISILVGLCFLIFIVGGGCKKTDINTADTVFPTHALTTSGISVSPYGFLTFDSTKNYEKFVDFCQNSSHSDVQSFLSSVRFSSIGSSTHTANSDMVTDSQIFDYLINDDSVYQVENVVVRISADTKFLYCMQSNRLTSS